MMVVVDNDVDNNCRDEAARSGGGGGAAATADSMQEFFRDITLVKYL